MVGDECKDHKNFLDRQKLKEIQCNVFGVPEDGDNITLNGNTASSDFHKISALIKHVGGDNCEVAKCKSFGNTRRQTEAN